jgi:hypothetical protein
MTRVREFLTDLARHHDVVAVQEVEPELAAWAAAQGWSTVYAQRPRHPDGVLLLREGGTLGSPVSGVSSEGRRVWCGGHVEGILVVCAHLDWDEPDSSDHVGARQARELLDWAAGHAHGGPAVIAADANGPWQGRVGQELAAGGYLPAGVGHPTAIAAGTARELDVIAARGAILHDMPRAGAFPNLLPDQFTPSDHVPISARAVPQTTPPAANAEPAGHFP